MKLNLKRDTHRMFLVRTSRKLSRDAGRRIHPMQVLEAILDMAIADEGVYDPVDGRPVSAERRAVLQRDRAARSQGFTAPEILERIKASEEDELGS